MQHEVFLGCPTHDGRIQIEAADMLFSAASEKPLIIGYNISSSLTSNCNFLYAKALNLRKQYPSIKWFAMIHSDVVPEPYFIDKMIDEAETHRADFLSAVIPIKDQRGLTSTAIGRFENANPVVTTRITMHQLQHLPTTFDVFDAVEALGTLYYLDKQKKPDILTSPGFDFNINNKETPFDPRLFANTGCMIVRLDRPWSERMMFTIFDFMKTTSDGEFVQSFFPEDWYFSSRVHSAGGKVMCTKKVKVKHVGTSSYDNHAVWGERYDPATKWEP